MFEKVPLAVRKYGALGGIGITLAAASGVKAGDIQAEQPENARTQQLEDITYIKAGSIALGDRHVTVFDQKGIKLPEQYSLSGLSRATHNADMIGKMDLIMNFSLTDTASGGNIPLPVELSPSGGSHIINVVKDPATLLEVTKAKDPPSADVSGYTVFDPLNRKFSKTFLAPPKEKYEEGSIRHDTHGINTENCNNLMSLKFTHKAKANVKALSGNTATGLRVLYRFASETVCNSYGYMIAYKEAGNTYGEYKARMNHTHLDFIKGLIFPMLTFPKVAWNSIKTSHQP